MQDTSLLPNSTPTSFQTVRVAAALIVEGQSFLVAKRQGSRHLAGYYELPGGKIEEHETAEQACIREIKEELGCDIKVESYLLTCEYDYPDVKRHLSMDVFVCRLLEGQKIEKKEHSDLRFVDAQTMDELEFAPADVQFLPQIKELLTKL